MEEMKNQENHQFVTTDGEILDALESALTRLEELERELEYDGVKISMQLCGMIAAASITGAVTDEKNRRCMQRGVMRMFWR